MNLTYSVGIGRGFVVCDELRVPTESGVAVGSQWTGRARAEIYVVIESVQLLWLNPFKGCKALCSATRISSHRIRPDRAAMRVNKRSSDWASPRMLISGSLKARIDCVGVTDESTARNSLASCQAYLVPADPPKPTGQTEDRFVVRESESVRFAHHRSLFAKTRRTPRDDSDSRGCLTSRERSDWTGVHSRFEDPELFTVIVVLCEAGSCGHAGVGNFLCCAKNLDTTLLDRRCWGGVRNVKR